jgi:outer membrane protein assembly factor BamB
MSDRAEGTISRIARPLAVAAALLGSLAFAAPLRADSPDQAKAILLAAGLKGGFLVHLGCSDGRCTLALRAGEAFIVQGLDTSAEKVAAARQYIRDAALDGAVSARCFNGKDLPFADGMVNLLVVEEPFSVPSDEMLRVLCPKGTLLVKDGGNWKSREKPWPAGMDEWTHYHHDPQGTMVGKDAMVGPPRRIQWMGEPKWLRNHDFMSSMTAMVSSGGRIFYVIDEGLRAHVFLPSRWTLVARDAFNGTVLWKRPLKGWWPNNWPLKSGPGDLPRKLVAVGDRVFVPLGYDEPLTELDAATGKVVRTYDGTKAANEIIFSDGKLYLQVDPAKGPVTYRAESTTYGEIKRANSLGWTRDWPQREIVAVQADSGKVLWRHAAKVAPLTLTVCDKSVFFFDGEAMVALDRDHGGKLWASQSLPGFTLAAATGAAPRVIYSDGVVVLCSNTRTFALAAGDGKLLWQGKTQPSGHFCPNDIFLIDGLLWSANTGNAQNKGTRFTALDLHTGQTAKDIEAENLPVFPMHARCYPSRATERYIMTAGMGTEFYVPGAKTLEVNNVVRGSCIYGVMPCNGLLYKPADSCACYYMSKLEHMCALAPAPAGPTDDKPLPDDQRLVKGPAYADAASGKALAAAGEDWPMFRQDTRRRGFCPSAVPAGLKKAWAVKLGGKLTQPVVAAGRLYVSSVDDRALYALDASNGKQAWRFLAGGRIDSPPTIHNGTVIFGSADGCVYCLRAADGELAWRYLVAPRDRQIISYQQPESVWPVHGSVLVHNDAVYALAGRNMFFDGGMRLVRLRAGTGEKLSETVLDELDPRTGKNLQTLAVRKSMPVANPDILSCDGKYVYMGAQRFDLDGKRVDIDSISAPGAKVPADSDHLFCPTGFLDDLWFHRTYWTYGASFPEGWAEYNIAQKREPSGRIMAIGESRAYGFRADNLGNTLLPTPMYRLYAADLAEKVSAKDAPANEADQPAPEAKAKARGKAGNKAKAQAGGKAVDPSKLVRRGDAMRPATIAGGFKVYWEVDSPPILPNAMTLAGGCLFIAGPPDVADESKMLGFLPGTDDEINRQLKAQEAAWRGEMGALLWAVSPADGKKLAEYKLDALPVWDGLAVANGKLFISLKDGTVACWDKE